MTDVIIIGGGPAGLQAALTLGRMHKEVLLFDSGDYRNGRVAHMHNFVTHDGTPPAKFRAEARAELASYPTVEVHDRAVDRVAATDRGFVVEAGGQRREARKLVLATGVRDQLPEVPGLADLWGDLAYGCPFCHGHELSGRPIGIIGGERALHLVSLLAPIGSSVTVFTDGPGLGADQVAALEREGVSVRPEPLAAVGRTESGGVRVALRGPADVEVADVELADVELAEVELADVEVAGIFVGTGQLVQSAPFAEQLSLDLLDSGCIAVDDFGRTSLPGVFAAGDLAHRPSQPMPMASVLAAAAAGQIAASACVAEILQD